eukprot:jgi/Mesen1/9138/ME000058S08623
MPRMEIGCRAAILVAVMFVVLLSPTCGSSSFQDDGGPIIIIGHRGSCGVLPEHTVAGYRRAIEAGSHFIECDVVMTKDGVAICRHEPDIAETTDVRQHPEFAGRMRTYAIDGANVTGFFAADFTLAEIKTLRAIQRLRFRDTSYDGLYEVPTLGEFLEVARSPEWGRVVGVYPETKHPTWHRSKGLNVEDALLAALEEHGYGTAAATAAAAAPVYVQSFEPGSLQYLRGINSRLSYVQLLDDGWDQPGYRFSVFGDGRAHSHGKILGEIAAYASAIGPWKNSIAPLNGTTRRLGAPTRLVEQAHAAGLAVHPYTFRNENEYLAFDYGEASVAVAVAVADPYEEYALFVDTLGVDGFFTDFPATAASYLRLRACATSSPSAADRAASSLFRAPSITQAGMTTMTVFVVLVAILPVAAAVGFKLYKWRQAKLMERDSWQELAAPAHVYTLDDDDMDM